jgi:hypothetical protein
MFNTHLLQLGIVLVTSLLLLIIYPPVPSSPTLIARLHPLGAAANDFQPKLLQLHAPVTDGLESAFSISRCLLN